MPDFQQTRNDLKLTRDARETARLNLFASAQRLRILEKERAALDREQNDNNNEFVKRRNDVETQISAAKGDNTKLAAAFAVIDKKLNGLEVNFKTFVDPRPQLQDHFSNQTPFLLFPLRIETRFKTVDGQSELWIRVYPDDCLVDSFEPLLSLKEVNNAARFWAEYYRSGKPADPSNPDPEIIESQKAAWRLLVRAHGDGRAAWITRQLVPDQSASVFPTRIPDKTVILAIVTDNLAPGLQAVITPFFKNLWFADRNEEKIKLIKADFNTANPTLDADSIINTFQPVNFNQDPPDGLNREDTDLQIAIVVFSDLKTKAGKEHGWSQPSRVNLLPERLALILYKDGKLRDKDPIPGNPIPYPLPTSPDPSPDAGNQFTDANGDLEFAEPIKWLADFDHAVDIGMGFRVKLKPDEVDRITRLLILGVKLGADADEGRKELQDLFDHHYFSNKGFSLLPQGTPTNNTGASDSGFTRDDSADQTFDCYFKQTPGFKETDDWNLKTDGQWFAEWLGLDYDFSRKLLHSDGLDQSDARNMNVALWPATMGYVMQSMMEGGFTQETVNQTRDFFNSFVCGRGPVPAIRIGNQPYGILPTAAFPRLGWTKMDDRFSVVANMGNARFLDNLYRLLLELDTFWSVFLTPQVPYVGKDGAEPYQSLLDIVGLNPTSIEFQRRSLETLVQINNAKGLFESSGYFQYPPEMENTITLLTKLGYSSVNPPQIAGLLGLPDPVPVKFLIDDLPPSETQQIRIPPNDVKNYIQALIDEARESLGAVRMGKELKERPQAELYRLLKFALEQSHYGSGADAALSVNAISPASREAMNVEQPFIHQLWKGEVTESRYALLYRTVPALSAVKTVSEFVTDSLQTSPVPDFANYLSSQLTAMQQLQGATTARLERALAEHLDCCSYRIDSWKTAILTNQLSIMRNNLGSITTGQRQMGMFLGAFGWLDNVKPNKDKVLDVKEVPADIVTDFNPDGKKVFLTDRANEGYIHTPSLNQGVTAAVLRNGYISHGKPDGNNVLAVNLTSERIRLALSIIEGIQGGQSLAALLGYHFERELHDRDDLKSKSIDSYIYSMRKLFPLNADHLKDTNVENNTDPSVDPSTVPITAIEARNVVDGKKLCEHVSNQSDPANKIYPFGLALPNPDIAVGTAITDAVNNIMNIADAVADMGVAESVHHIVMGNVDRAAGVLESFSTGNYPQEPDVIRTPRSGATLTHRVGVPFGYVALDEGAGPRAQAEPSVNAWLTKILPPMMNIVCRSVFSHRSDGSPGEKEISLADIGISPIDLLYVADAIDSRSMNELDDRFIDFLYNNDDPRIDDNILLNYTQSSADPTKFSVFEVMPLVRSLRAVLLESRPLAPGDLALPNEANQKNTPPPELPAKRVQNLVNNLTGLLDAATAPGGVINDLEALPAADIATESDRDNMRQKVDDTITRFCNLYLNLARYGLPQTGIGSLYAQRQQWFISLKNKVREFIDRWQKRSDDYNILAAQPPLPDTLQAMERLISSSVTPSATITLPIVQGEKSIFDTKFTSLKNIVSANQPTIIKLIQDIQAIDATPVDVLSIDISKELQQIPMFMYDLQARAQTLAKDLGEKRIPDVNTALSGLNTLTPSDQVTQLEAAARIVLGEQFKMIPRHVLPATQQAEIANSWNATGNLLSYSLMVEKRTNPQEDWLHGMARVHEKMKHLENCIFLREAFGMNEDDLSIHPVQLPFHKDPYHWLALPFPTADVDMERSNTLLYTACVAKSAVPPTEVCGMLVDEWTELIPANEETTGIAFHYDRPNSEAPQTLLLVTPTQLAGNWSWDDLVDALIYTRDAAKSRAVTPGMIEKTPLASLLPAVLAAESLFPYSIVLDNKAHYKSPDNVINFRPTV